MPVTAPKGGQFVLHAKALHGNPYDGHTLGPVIADLEKLTGVTVRRIHGDKGYRGHNYPNRFKVWISGQVRRVTKAIRREMRRRAAIEPVIGHLKQDHRMGRNYLTGRDGDRINAVLAAAGYNFSLLLRWFEELLRVLSLILCHALLAAPLHLTRCRKTFFTADCLERGLTPTLPAFVSLRQTQAPPVLDHIICLEVPSPIWSARGALLLRVRASAPGRPH